MKVEIPDLTGAECGDIAITAAEGGIGYWSQIESYHWQRRDDLGEGWVDDDGKSIEVDDNFVFYTLRADLTDDSTYAGKPIDITPALLRLGFQRMLDAPLDRGGWAGARMLGIAREDWTGEIDSDIADMIVQFGVFGELTYG